MHAERISPVRLCSNAARHESGDTIGREWNASKGSRIAEVSVSIVLGGSFRKASGRGGRGVEDSVKRGSDVGYRHSELSSSLYIAHSI